MQYIWNITQYIWSFEALRTHTQVKKFSYEKEHVSSWLLAISVHLENRNSLGKIKSYTRSIFGGEPSANISFCTKLPFLDPFVTITLNSYWNPSRNPSVL